MKHNRYRAFRGAMLGLVLLAAAIPFAVRAQSDASNEVVLTFEATVAERGLFVFQNDVIEYRKGANYPDPTDVTIDGKPWANLSEPFQLGFTPDFAKAAIVEKEGRGTIEVFTMPKQIGLSIVDNVESSSAPYKVMIAVKNQGNREPAPSLAITPRAPESQPVQLVDPHRRGGIKKIPGRVYPKEFEERMKELEKNTREKNRIAQMERSYSINAAQLSLTQRKAVEQYREERMQERNLWLRDPDYTTDGKELPPVGWATTPVSRKPFPDQFDITIEATVNVVAKFAFQGNRIVYRDSSHPNDGKYPSQVKINGKPWKNLHLPFKLDSAIDQDSILGTEIETEFYRYTLHPEGEWTALTILNHGLRDEEPVKIKLTVLKSKKPYDDNFVYSGGVALPAEVMTNPEAFENFWKNAMRGGNSGAGRSPAGQPANQPGAATQPGAPATDNPGR